MFSIIICSISPQRLHDVQENIRETIGVAHEIIAIDNRERGWPIARAYNYGASQARYPFLFFVHEDVKFHSHGWGAFVGQKLQEESCGVIGFAGSKVMLKAYSGWDQYYDWNCYYFCQTEGPLSRFYVCNVSLQNPFEEVVTIDGLGMFVRSEVWQEHPFDEHLLTGFHCYDVDFSLQIAADGRYKNYICCSNRVLIEHFSKGSFNLQWYMDTVRMFRRKWRHILPLCAVGWLPNEKLRKKHEERLAYTFLRKLLKTSSPDKRLVLVEYWRGPLSWRRFRHGVTCTFGYLKSLFG